MHFWAASVALSMHRCNCNVASQPALRHTAAMPLSADAELIASVEAAVTAHGLDAVTLEHIASAAGVNRVTLYRRGHTRESLLAQAAASATAEFRDASLAPLTHNGTAPERLDLLAEALFDLADRHLVLLAGLFDGPAAMFHLALGDHQVLTRQEYTDPFARVLSDGLTEGTLATADPDEDAEVLFNLLGWTYIHLRRSHDWDPTRARVALKRQLRAWERLDADAGDPTRQVPAPT